MTSPRPRPGETWLAYLFVCHGFTGSSGGMRDDFLGSREASDEAMRVMAAALGDRVDPRVDRFMGREAAPAGLRFREGAHA